MNPAESIVVPPDVVSDAAGSVLPLLLPVFRHGIEHRSNGVVSLGAGIAFLR